MLPVIVLIGRPNVGKSTLFNRLTQSRDALVADQPGLTRDRQYGLGKLGPSPYMVVDTGGLSGIKAGIDILMEQQVKAAIAEADHILYLVDARSGLNSADEQIATELRKLGKPLSLVVNKSESLDKELVKAEFYALGLGEPIPISAAHGRGVKPLMQKILAQLPPAEIQEENNGIEIAVIGRPNVGKSTLINRLLGEERLVAYDQPGTTRDSIRVPFEREGQSYVLIDTAGMRRKARIDNAIEKFSIIKTLQAMQQAQVVLLVLDAQAGIAEQDATLAGHIIDSGRALVVVVNKWDGLDQDRKNWIKLELERKLPFLSFAQVLFVSALHGSNVGHLMPAVQQAYQAAHRHLKTSELNEALHAAVQAHPPPLVRGRRIKLRYAHQGGQNPPLIVIHGNQTQFVPASYRRYLVNYFRDYFQLQGTPIRIEFRTGDNPYQGKRNRLTPRQRQKRRRLMRFVKK